MSQSGSKTSWHVVEVLIAALPLPSEPEQQASALLLTIAGCCQRKVILPAESLRVLSQGVRVPAAGIRRSYRLK